VEMKKRVITVLMIALIFSAAFPLSSFAAKNCLNKTKVNMTVGGSIQLKMKYKTGKVKWSSSKKSEIIGINIDEQAVSSLILQKIRQDKNEIYRNYIQTSV
jgi:hypothetical protein